MLENFKKSSSMKHKIIIFSQMTIALNLIESLLSMMGKYFHFISSHSFFS